MAIKVDLTALPDLTNDSFYPLHKDKSRYLVLYGGAGSGKSVFAAQKLLVRMLTERPHRFLVVRKVAKTLRCSVFSLCQDIISEWGLTKLFKINKSDMAITCINGNQILFAGLDDVEKLKSIAGITGIWIEEASELEEGDFHQLDLRLRGKTRHYKQIMLSFNPISALHWLKRAFFDIPKDGASVIHSTYKDNKFLDPEYAKVLEALKIQDRVLYDIYALGKWGVLGNLILTNWTVDKATPVDDSAYDRVLNGMDFGFNHPSALVRVGLKDGELYIFDEIYERGLTNAELIDRVKEKVPKNQNITADSAEPARIKEFRQSGFLVRPSVKGANSVRDGIDFLRRYKIHIHPSCANTVKEIQGWKYKEDRDGNVLEEPVPFMDDAMAALRYATEELWKRRVRGVLEKPKGW